MATSVYDSVNPLVAACVRNTEDDVAINNFVENEEIDNRQYAKVNIQRAS